MKKYTFLAAIALAGFTSCQSEFENPIDENTYHSGEADFSVYVAVGNSLTAGFMDGTVFRTGQEYSFPNILAEQMKVAGGGAFTQPSFADDVNDIGGMTIAGNPIPGFSTRIVIVSNANGSGPQNLAGTPTIEVTQLQQKAYNNMGVSGAKSFHLLSPGYGSLTNLAIGKANPYFVRHATSPEATVLGDAMSLNPTFFTNWIGANDVLSYAMSGGTGTNQQGNLNPATYGASDITDPQVFAGVYSNIINTLTSNGAKGVVATIPYVTSIPFFTTVPYNPLTTQFLGGAENVNNLNQRIFGALKQIFTAYGEPNRIKLLSTTAPNPLLINDETLPDRTNEITTAVQNDPVMAPLAQVIGQIYGKARHATANDLFVLTASRTIGQLSQNPLLNMVPENIRPMIGIQGVTFPLGDEMTLISSEQNEIRVATDAFNQTIKSIAAQKNLAVADMNQMMQQLSNGLKSDDGQIYTADYFSGATNMNTVMFSLDGIHPNARGYAFIANEIVKVINKHYKSNLPHVYVGKYPGAKIITSNN